MSESSVRGKSFEMRVQKITRRLLGLDVKRDKQSGAGVHKQDIRDRYNELPIFIECKDQKTLKPKEWWRVADGKSSVGQAPIVVFPDDEEILCVMRYIDVLQLIKEARDWHAVAESERAYQTGPQIAGLVFDESSNIDPVLLEKVSKKIEGGAQVCRNSHLSDGYGYCSIKNCPYSRGYRRSKVKK